MSAAAAPAETPTRIEPCLVDEPRGELLDLLAELPVAATRLGARLSPRTAASLADLVRVMNCYYSNLIEGHNTRPRDIVRAWGDEFDTDEGRGVPALPGGEARRALSAAVRGCVVPRAPARGRSRLTRRARSSTSS